MRPTTTIKLYSLLLVLLALALTAAWSAWQKRNLLEGSYDAAISITTQTLSSGSASTLLSVADPRFMAGWDEDGVQRYIDLVAARLGRLERLAITAGGIETLPLPFIHRQIEASYSLTLYFPETMATAEIVLVAPTGSAQHWRLADFRVDSPLLND